VIVTIKLFLWTHPWWHAALVIVPPLVLTTVIGWGELHHSKIANRMREKANTLTKEANDLRDKLNGAMSRIAGLTEELNRIEVQKNQAMAQSAVNVRPPVTQAERNAAKLRFYLRKTAQVSELQGTWGGMGAEIVEVNEDNILTLFVAAGHSSSSAWAQCVHCDKLQIVEAPVGGCALQLKVLERYGEPIQLGEIRRWEDRNIPSTSPRPRGDVIFHVKYRDPSSPHKRGIYIYAPTEGNPQYTLQTFVDQKAGPFLYGDNIDISKKFAILQVEYLAAGCQFDTTGGGHESLFVCTH